ncbi:amidohydrolase [Geodermatophilus sp. SYSU D01186]
MSAPADTVLVGRAITMGPDGEPDGPVAIGIRDGSITDVVPAAHRDALTGDRTTVVDVGDRVLVPGFVDPHVHSEVAARTRYLTVDCRAPGCRTVADVLDVLTSALPEARDGWLVGEANLFFDRKLADGRFPTRQELDGVSRSVAIVLRCGGHLSVLNTRALELAGIDADYRSVDHSITGLPTVERDPSGAPTGVVKEMDNLLPLPDLEPGELQRAVEEGIADLFTRHGVTTLGEISETVTGLRAYDAALAAGTLATRMHFYLWVPGTTSLDDAVRYREWADFSVGRELARIQGVKMFSDGGYSAASAAMKRPYVLPELGPDHCGHVALSREQLIEALRRTADAGLQLAVHANGDRAQDAVCEAFAEVRAELPAGAPTPRIEHAGNFVPDYAGATAGWRRAGIVPCPQPVFIRNFGAFVPEYVGEYARRGQFPFRRLLDDGWPISASSDVWIGSDQGQTNPFASIAACVGRADFHGDPLEPDQAVTVEEALRMHTLHAARALGEGDTRGSLEPGKFADVAVLDRDPRRCGVEELTGTTVEQVYLGGRLVHDRTGSLAAS